MAEQIEVLPGIFVGLGAGTLNKTQDPPLAKPDDEELFPGSGVTIGQALLGKFAEGIAGIQGVGENALMMGTGAASELAAAPGIMMSVTHPEMLEERGVRSGAEFRDVVADKMTYQPQSAGAKQQLQTMGKGVEAATNKLLPIREGYENWANETLGPEIGGGLYAGTMAGLSVLPIGAVTRPGKAAVGGVKNALARQGKDVATDAYRPGTGQTIPLAEAYPGQRGGPKMPEDPPLTKLSPMADEKTANKILEKDIWSKDPAGSEARTRGAILEYADWDAKQKGFRDLAHKREFDTLSDKATDDFYSSPDRMKAALDGDIEAIRGTDYGTYVMQNGELGWQPYEGILDPWRRHTPNELAAAKASGGFKEKIKLVEENKGHIDDGIHWALIQKKAETDPDFKMLRSKLDETGKRDKYERALQSMSRDELKAEIDRVFDTGSASDRAARRGWGDDKQRGSLGDTTKSKEVNELAARTTGRSAVASEHELDVSGGTRFTEATNLRPGESEVVGKLPTHQQQAGRNIIRAKREQYPVSDGWAPIKAKKVTQGKTRKGEAKLNVEFEPVNYGFARKSDGSLLTAGGRTARKNKVVQGLVDEVNDVRKRAAAGDKNASVIVRQQEWYRGMRRELREKYGGIGDLFADLLGAASPMTAVMLNYRYAAEVLEKFTKGGFRKELKAFDDHIEAGGTIGNYNGPQILQPNGKLYGANSDNIMLALYNMWRGTGQAPKARNFSGNLIGSTNAATIDVWAARSMQRLAGLRRIPPAAETSVKGTWNKARTSVGSDFGFGQEVFAEAAQKLGMSPDDLQALVWFREKELWGKNKWTTKLGEGGSFEQEALKYPSERTVAGLSTDRPDVPATRESMQAVQDRIWTNLSNDPEVKAVKVEQTIGMYMDDIEPSFDIELVTKPNHDPTDLFNEVATAAKQSNQDSAFVSRVITDPTTQSANVRPGLEVYFAKSTNDAGAQELVSKIRDMGVDGFTVIKDPRGGVVGLRYQYVPEFDVMYGNKSIDDLDNMIKSNRELLDDLLEEVSGMDNISHAEVMDYDTVVMTGNNYDDFIGTGTNRLAAGKGKAWPKRSVHESVSAATGRTAGAPAPGAEGAGSNALIKEVQ